MSGLSVVSNSKSSAHADCLPEVAVAEGVAHLAVSLSAAPAAGAAPLPSPEASLLSPLVTESPLTPCASGPLSAPGLTMGALDVSLTGGALGAPLSAGALGVPVSVVAVGAGVSVGALGAELGADGVVDASGATCVPGGVCAPARGTLGTGTAES